VAVSLNKIWVG